MKKNSLYLIFSIVLTVLYIVMISVTLHKRQPQHHTVDFVTYKFIDTLNKDTSYEGINIDAVCDYLKDSDQSKYNTPEFKRLIVDRLIKYGNRDTTIYLVRKGFWDIDEINTDVRIDTNTTIYLDTYLDTTFNLNIDTTTTNIHLY